MSENNQNNDSSRAIIRLLTTLVAILGLLLVTFVIATGVLVYAYIGAADPTPVANGEPATTLRTPDDNPGRRSDSAAAPTQSGRPVDVAASEPEALGSLPKKFAVAAAANEPTWRYNLTGDEPMIFDFYSAVFIESTEISNKGRVTYKVLEDDPVEYLRCLLYTSPSPRDRG